MSSVVGSEELGDFVMVCKSENSKNLANILQALSFKKDSAQVSHHFYVFLTNSR
jgi:hypothetical protein